MQREAWISHVLVCTPAFPRRNVPFLQVCHPTCFAYLIKYGYILCGMQIERAHKTRTLTYPLYPLSDRKIFFNYLLFHFLKTPSIFMLGPLDFNMFYADQRLVYLCVFQFRWAIASSADIAVCCFFFFGDRLKAFLSDTTINQRRYKQIIICI